MQKKDQIYEGKAKVLYTTDHPDQLIQAFKDSATAFDGTKKGIISQKGFFNNQIAATLFKLLESKGIRTHFIETLSERDMLIKRVKIFLVEVVVRNIAAGSLVKRLGLPEGQILETPIVELYYKNDALHDPLVNRGHIQILKLANPTELDWIEATALAINQHLTPHFAERGLRLVDFKLEFGRSGDQMLLADEISPDTCRLWDIQDNRKLDKDRFRFDLGQVEDAYAEVYRRITGNN